MQTDFVENEILWSSGKRINRCNNIVVDWVHTLKKWLRLVHLGLHLYITIKQHVFTYLVKLLVSHIGQYVTKNERASVKHHTSQKQVASLNYARLHVTRCCSWMPSFYLEVHVLIIVWWHWSETRASTSVLLIASVIYSPLFGHLLNERTSPRFERHLLWKRALNVQARCSPTVTGEQRSETPH